MDSFNAYNKGLFLESRYYNERRSYVADLFTLKVLNNKFNPSSEPNSALIQLAYLDIVNTFVFEQRNNPNEDVYTQIYITP